MGFHTFGISDKIAATVIGSSAATEGSTDKNVVGGKGASLGLMTQMGLSVPPGFTIPISYCNGYYASNSTGQYVTSIMFEAGKYLKALTEKNKGVAPLLSVRSGAPVSMPGMMDTILNVGLTSTTLPLWIEMIGERAALDSYRRLILMLGTTAFGVEEKLLNAPLDLYKTDMEFKFDTDVPVEGLQLICKSMLEIFHKETGKAFPNTILAQLSAAIDAVFRSWNSERAVVYRKLNKLENVEGTAVTVQAMVFGNLNDDSGTGVLFTKNPLTGEPGMYGEYLMNAQGEDVVAGIRTPIDVNEMTKDNGETWPAVHSELVETCAKLEKFYKDMVDIEFTVQDGQLYILQSRVGKRSSAAAIRIALDLAEDKVIVAQDVFKRITRNQYKINKRPAIDPKFNATPFITGLNASPGVAVGKAVFSSKQAVAEAEKGETVILITTETTPDDIAGMNAAAGILTATGGATSHAAVVARAMDRPCVCGATGLIVGQHHANYEGATINQGDTVTLCGSTGRVWVNTDVPVSAGADKTHMNRLHNMVARDAYQTLNLHEADHENLPDRVSLHIAHCCMAGIDAADIVASIQTIEALGKKIALNFDPTEMNETSRLRSIFTADPVKVEFIKTINALLSMASKKQLKANQIMTYGSTPDVRNALIKMHFRVSKKITKVGDLLGGDALEIDDAFVAEHIGTQEQFDQLKEALAAAGKLAPVASRDIHVEYELFTHLAE